MWAKRADGSLSPPTITVLHIDSSPGVTSRGPFGEDAVAHRPVSFTFTAAQEDAARVGSAYDGEEHPEQTVAVGAETARRPSRTTSRAAGATSRSRCSA